MKVVEHSYVRNPPTLHVANTTQLHNIYPTDTNACEDSELLVEPIFQDSIDFYFKVYALVY